MGDGKKIKPVAVHHDSLGLTWREMGVVGGGGTESWPGLTGHPWPSHYWPDSLVYPSVANYQHVKQAVKLLGMAL